MTANALGAVSPAVHSDECRQSMTGADQIVLFDEDERIETYPARNDTPVKRKLDDYFPSV